MRTAAQMLADIPQLATEVQLTAAIGAPNPGQRVLTGRSVPGSRPPLDLAALYAGLPDRLGLRGQLVMCVRLVSQEAGQSDLSLPDQPADDWPSVCGWLALTQPWWDQQVWANDIEYEVWQVWRSLRACARVVDQPRLVCTRYGCGAAAQLQPGGRWVRCSAGHTLDVEAERGRHLSMQDWTLAECRRALLQYQSKRVPQSKLEKWVERGQLQPIRHEWRVKRDRPVAVYNFGAVMRLVAQWEQRRAQLTP